jgi:uncharacterized membrane protein YGL010W
MEIYSSLESLADSFAKHFDDNDIKAKLNNFDVIAWVKDYIRHGEYGLAFDTLCDNLYEWDVPITLEEFKQIELVGQTFFSEHSRKWGYLLSLVKSSD